MSQNTSSHVEQSTPETSSSHTNSTFTTKRKYFNTNIVRPSVVERLPDESLAPHRHHRYYRDDSAASSDSSLVYAEYYDEQRNSQFSDFQDDDDDDYNYFSNANPPTFNNHSKSSKSLKRRMDDLNNDNQYEEGILPSGQHQQQEEEEEEGEEGLTSANYSQQPYGTRKFKRFHQFTSDVDDSIWDLPPSSPPPVHSTTSYNNTTTAFENMNETDTDEDDVGETTLINNDECTSFNSSFVRNYPNNSNEQATSFSQQQQQQHGLCSMSIFSSQSMASTKKPRHNRNNSIINYRPPQDSGGGVDSELGDDCYYDDSDYETSNPHQSTELILANNEAVRRIKLAIDDVNPRVNLDSLGIRTIPKEVKDLKDLVVLQGSIVSHDVQLFLYNNMLTRLPEELFQLSNLTVLSLRQNQLTHIPPAISRLVNLRDLSLSANKLKYLPWELFLLPKLKILNPHYNPFQKIENPKDWEVADEYKKNVYKKMALAVAIDKGEENDHEDPLHSSSPHNHNHNHHHQPCSNNNNNNNNNKNSGSFLNSELLNLDINDIIASQPKTFTDEAFRYWVDFQLPGHYSIVEFLEFTRPKPIQQEDSSLLKKEDQKEDEQLSSFSSSSPIKRKSPVLFQTPPSSQLSSLSSSSYSSPPLSNHKHHFLSVPKLGEYCLRILAQNLRGTPQEFTNLMLDQDITLSQSISHAIYQYKFGYTCSMCQSNNSLQQQQQQVQIDQQIQQKQQQNNCSVNFFASSLEWWANVKEQHHDNVVTKRSFCCKSCFVKYLILLWNEIPILLQRIIDREKGGGRL